MNRSALIRFLILAGLTLVAYIPTFDWMIGRWSAADTYYSHGFLVPFVSIGIIWLKRKELFALPAKPSFWGWPILIIGVLIFLLSALWRVYFSSGFSLILVIAGLVLVFLGVKHLKTLWFPI